MFIETKKKYFIPLVVDIAEMRPFYFPF